MNQTDPQTASESAALHELLALTGPLKRFVATAERHLLEPDSHDWQALIAEGRRLAELLAAAPQLVEGLLANDPATSRLKMVSYLAGIVRAWPDHPRRHHYRTLFDRYRIDSRIVIAIDEALSEDEGNLLDLLHLDLRRELRAMLERQVAHFGAELVAGLERAGSNGDRHDALLAVLPHDPRHGPRNDELLYDVFDDGILSANDLELTIAAIATFALLKG